MKFKNVFKFNTFERVNVSNKIISEMVKLRSSIVHSLISEYLRYFLV